MLSVVFLSLYFCGLLSFSFITHPIGYCFMLVVCAFSVAGYTYLILGFSWYVALFCLVYVGGIYVLFIFVSLHCPNPSPGFNGGFSFLLFSFFFLMMLFYGSYRSLGGSVVERTHYLCSFFEGVTYIFFCLVLMLGFVIISVVSSGKDGFFR